MLVILDKDGTLVEPASGAQFVQSPMDQRLLLGVADRIAELKAMGATLVVVSNQGGVEAGHKTSADTKAEMRYLLKLLPDISQIWYCEKFDGDYALSITDLGDDPSIIYSASVGAPSNLDGTYRKPGPGMLMAAIHDYQDDDAIMIGDRPEDAEAALNAGIPFVDAEAWRSGKVVITPKSFIV